MYILDIHLYLYTLNNEINHCFSLDIMNIMIMKPIPFELSAWWYVNAYTPSSEFYIMYLMCLKLSLFLLIHEKKQKWTIIWINWCFHQLIYTLAPALHIFMQERKMYTNIPRKKHWEGQGMVKAKFVRTATIFIHYFRIQLLRIREGLKSWLGTEQMPLSLLHGSLLDHHHQESNYGQSPWDHLLSCLRRHQVGPHIKADQKQAVVVRGLEESL